jgi:hypothetical protein
VEKNNYKALTTTFLALLLIATTTISTIFAVPDAFADNRNDNNNDDKVKLDCLDAALTLVTLDFAIDLGGDDLEDDLSSTLDEAEIAPDLESIEENFQNVLDKLEDRCNEENVQDILEFIDFTD